MSNEFTNKILELVKKDFGENVAKGGQDFIKEVKTRLTIPVSPAVNLAIGGGIPEGSWVVLAGKPKCGKTTLALYFCSKCQQPKYGSKHIYILNVEGRLKEMNLKGYNLNPDQVTIIESTEEKILSAQDYLTIGEKILLNHKACVVVIDSFSALCHEKELTDGIGTSTRGGGAALLAQFCRQMESVVPVKKSIVIGITHLMANTSGYGAGIMEKGGNAIQYQVDVKLRCKGVEAVENDGKRIGQKVTWITEATALGMPPGVEFDSIIKYGQGIDEVAEAIKLGLDVNLISKSGSWYVCDFMQNHLPVLGVMEWNDEAKKKCKGQGEHKLGALLKANPNWIEILEKEIQKILY